jgi:hypothetical protein
MGPITDPELVQQTKRLPNACTVYHVLALLGTRLMRENKPTESSKMNRSVTIGQLE